MLLRNYQLQEKNGTFNFQKILGFFKVMNWLARYCWLQSGNSCLAVATVLRGLSLPTLQGVGSGSSSRSQQLTALSWGFPWKPSLHMPKLGELAISAIANSLLWKLLLKELFTSLKTSVRFAGHPCNCDQLTNNLDISKICFAKQMTLVCPRTSVVPVFNPLLYNLFLWGRCRALWFMRQRGKNTFPALFSSWNTICHLSPIATLAVVNTQTDSWPAGQARMMWSQDAPRAGAVAKAQTQLIPAKGVPSKASKALWLGGSFALQCWGWTYTDIEPQF